MDRDLLTADEVAQQLNVSRTAVWRLTRAGLLRAIRITERRYRYRQADVDEYQASRFTFPTERTAA